jgi:hypothetical protein
VQGRHLSFCPTWLLQHQAALPTEFLPKLAQARACAEPLLLTPTYVTIVIPHSRLGTPCPALLGVKRHDTIAINV